MSADTKMELFFKQRSAIFSCNKCNMSAMSADGLTFSALNKAYDDFKKIHSKCEWKPS